MLGFFGRSTLFFFLFRALSTPRLRNTDNHVLTSDVLTSDQSDKGSVCLKLYGSPGDRDGAAFLVECAETGPYLCYEFSDPLEAYDMGIQLMGMATKWDYGQAMGCFMKHPEENDDVTKLIEEFQLKVVDNLKNDCDLEYDLSALRDNYFEREEKEKKERIKGSPLKRMRLRKRKEKGIKESPLKRRRKK